MGGFFEVDYVPANLATEELVLANLYPLLDQNGHGCVTADQLMFLEKDRVKRARIQSELARIREGGIEAAAEPLRNDAQRMLHKLCMRNTSAGGKHWATLKPGVAVGQSKLSKLGNVSTSQAFRILSGAGGNPSRKAHV